MFTSCVRVILPALCCVAIATAALANPSDKEPFGPLEVHGQQFAAELLITAQDLEKYNRTKLDEYEGYVAKNTLNKVNVNELGKVHVGVTRLQRAADQLVILGEPAGVDFRLRAGLQRAAVTRVALALTSQPTAAQGIGVMRTKAGAVAQQHQKLLPKLQKLVEKQDWEDAEKQVLEFVDDIEPFALYLPSDERIGLYSPWKELLPNITGEMTKVRQAAADKLLAERFETTKPDLAKLVADVNAAAAALKQSGKHAVDGKDLTGPELIAHFDTRWQQAHVATLKALAVEAARSPLADAAPTPNWKTLREDYEKFAKEMAVALRGLISADSAKVDAQSAPALYQAYLLAVADLVDHTGGALQAELQSALDELSNKSPELAANVAAYRAATDELLRWRERIATEQAKAKNLEPLPTPARAAFVPTAESAGLFPAEANAPLANAAKLNDVASRALIAGSPKIVGKSVAVDDVSALGGSSKAGIARYQDRIYARVTLPIEALAPEVANLEAQLFASEKQPPMSLAATRAVRSARRGDVVLAGGTVNGVFLEGYITRFAALPDAAALLVALGTLPPEYRERDQLEQVVLRFDVQPKWVQCRHLFLELP